MVARQPRVDPNTPNVGDALQVAAQPLVQLAAQQKQAERATLMSQARVQATEELGRLTVEFENDTNVIGLAQRFDSASDEVLQSIAATLPEGRMRDDFTSDFRQQRAPRTTALMRREVALTRDAGRAQLNSGLRTYQTQAAQAPDADSQAAVFAQAAQDIGAAQAADWISAQEAEALLNDVITGTADTAAITTLQDDPAAFLERAEEGEFNALDPKQLAAYVGRAKTAVASETARLERQAVLVEKEQAALLRSDVDDAVDIIESGRAYDGVDTLLDRASGTPQERRLKATIAASLTEGNFATLTPADQLAVIDTVKGSATNDPDDVDRLDRLRVMHAKTVESLEADPLTHVANRRLSDIAAINLEDPASIRRRVAQAEAVAVDYNEGRVLRYFTNGERDVFRADLARADADGQMALATGIVNGFGDRAPAALAEIGEDDPIFAMAGRLVMTTNELASARMLLQGRQMIAEKTGAKPDKAARQNVSSMIVDAFPSADRQRATTLLSAADAHFASAGLGVDPDATEAELRNAYMKSVQAVSGQVRRNGVTYGGLQEVNGRITLLPPSLTAPQAEDLLAGATAADLASAAPTGNAPLWGDTPLPDPSSNWLGRSQRDDLHLLDVGGGFYLVGIERSDGELRFLTDPGSIDGYFYFDLEALRQTRAGADQ